MNYNILNRNVIKLEKRANKAYLRSLKNCVDLEEAQQVTNGWNNFLKGIELLREGLKQL